MSAKINKNGKKYPIGVIPQGYPSTNIGYNNSQSGLSADNVQEAIDEIAEQIDNKVVVSNLMPTFSVGTSDQTFDTLTVNLTEKHIVMIEASTYVNKSGNGTFQLYVRIDGVDHTIAMLSQTITSFMSGSYAEILNAGSHTIQIRGGCDSSGATANNESYKKGSYTIALI